MDEARTVKKFYIPLAAALLSVLVGSCAPTDEVRETDTNVVLFEGARLIPGDGSAPIQSALLLVRDGAIEHVGPMGTIDVPEGASTVDLTGKTVMPLIVNVHGHVGYWKGGYRIAEKQA